MSHYKVTFVPGAENHCWNKAFNLMRDGADVLDVGCSTGNFGEALTSHKQCIVDGVEPDEGDARTASKVLNRVFHGIVEDAFKKELKDRKYDHIVFMDVIEHLVNPSAVLSGLKTHLKTGGSIVFSIPNMAHLSTRLMLLSGKFDYGYTGLLDHTHLRFYTKEEVERVFNEAGYEVEVWDYTEATYPEELIIKELMSLGLTANKKALEIFQKDDAKIFQFVGRAVLKQKKPKKRVEYSPDPQGQITRHFEEILSIANEKVAAKQREIDDCTAIIKDLQFKLSDSEYLATRVPARKYARVFINRKLKGSKRNR